MTTFARDSCTDADGTLLQNHAPEVGGPWTKEGSGVDLTINTGRVVFDGTTSGTTYYLGGLAATDEFDVEARFVRLGTPPSDGQLALTFRNDAAASTFYRLRWVESNLAWQWGKTIAGALTVIGSSTAQPLNAANPARTVKVVCRNALKEFFVDGVKIGETTDNAITGFRRVGTRPYRAGTATNGFALDDLLAADLVVSDTTPPAVPTGLAATPGDTQVALSWTANAESDLAGYRLYRDGVGIYDGAAATFTDATVVNGTTYSYTVSAYDIAGNESAKSTAVQATPAAPPPPADTTPPAVPTGLTAAPGDAQVSLDWSDNVEGDLAGYRLYRDATLVYDGAASAFADVGLVNGTAYSYTVSAYDTAANESTQSTAIQATPTAPGTPPPATPRRSSSRSSSFVTLTVDGRQVRAPEGLTFSNADPGGCQSLTVQVPNGTMVRTGAQVAVHCGLAWAWHGRVNATGPDDSRAPTRQVEAVGDGAALTDDPTFSMIYVDRDLARWTGMSRSRRMELLGLGYGIHDANLSPDTSNAEPALILSINQPPPVRQIAEGLYDAGENNRIARVVYTVDRTAIPGLPWELLLHAGDADTSQGDRSANLAAGGSVDRRDYVPSTAQRFIHLRLDSNSATDDNTHEAAWRLLVMIGDHGLTLAGPANDGLYPQDIARHAVQIAQPDWKLRIDDQADYIAPHITYPTSVAREQVVGDMAGLLGWHYGTWPPDSILGDEPVFAFTKPPDQATCVVHRRDCESFEAPQSSIDRLYNACQVTYRDPAGSPGMVTVTQANPLLAQAGIARRTLSVDLGVGSAAAARDLGELALGLAIANARGGGSATVRGDVGLPGGGRKPACLLRAGRDRVQVPDLPDSGPLVGVPGERAFLVRRVESTLQSDGSLSTRIEFDQGADLLEVLQARLQSALVGPSPGAGTISGGGPGTGGGGGGSVVLGGTDTGIY